MKTIDETRRENLETAIKRHKTATALAELVGTSPAYLSQIRNASPDSKTGKPKGMGDDLARKIEVALFEMPGWMDVEHGPQDDDKSIKSHTTGMIDELPYSQRGKNEHANTELGPDYKGTYPLISWVQAGNWEAIVDNFAPGDAEDWLDSPVKLSEGSFYLRVKGQSMYDPNDHRSFQEGEIIAVDPHKHAENGSFVVVRLDDDQEATFKQLILEGGKKFLKALNPSWPNRIFEVNGNATICGVVKTKVVQY